MTGRALVLLQIIASDWPQAFLALDVNATALGIRAIGQPTKFIQIENISGIEVEIYTFSIFTQRL